MYVEEPFRNLLNYVQDFQLNVRFKTKTHFEC